jgi:CheY-like chemotaxis protein/HPt (histidine-containing phosphotransfer) domain-containing protein
MPEAAPSVLPVEAAPAAIGGDAAAANMLRVLLVEDERTNQMIATARLKGLGYEVDVAGNGNEAVAAVEAADYDVVLMDLFMPEMDGLEATRAIRSLPGPAGAVPIIALTGSSGDCYVGACLEAGMNDFLSKPFTDAFLAAAIDRARAQRDAGGVEEPELVAEEEEKLPPAPVAPAPRAEDAAAKRVLEVADIFLNDAERRLAAMQSLLIAGDAKALERAAHALEGAAATFGFHRLAALAAEIGSAAGRPMPLYVLERLNEAVGAISIARS